MATSPPKSNTGKPSDLRAEYMLIRFTYSCQLILPIDQGNEFLKTYSSAREYKKEYNQPAEILPCPPEVTIQYLTKAEMAKINFDLSLGHIDS